MPISAPATMPNATSTMSVTSVGAVGNADALTACAIRRRRPDEREHVAAVDRRRREHGERRARRAMSRRRNTLRANSSLRELGERAAVHAGVA